MGCSQDVDIALDAGPAGLGPVIRSASPHPAGTEVTEANQRGRGFVTFILLDPSYTARSPDVTS